MFEGGFRMKVIVKILLPGLIIAILNNTDLFAQRYSHDNSLGGIENVKFVAERNGGTIEFSWNIQTTREISAVEVQKGTINEYEEINWQVVKEFSIDESTFVDYDPNTGKLYYKLVLIGKDGTAREYEPKYLIKGKS